MKIDKKSLRVKIKDYLSLVKFSHTVFAMPFAFIGFFLGYVHIDYNISFLRIFIAVVLCMIFARNNAMSFNRYLDRDIDKLNPRTLTREIPAEIIKPKSALLFTVINGLLFIITTYFINKLCFYLSPVALLVINGYSYTKRFTGLSHLVLGLGLSLAPIGAYIAVTGKFHYLPILYSFIVLFWVSGFDIIYSLQDEEFDKTHNLKSIPALMGKRKALHLSEVLHIITSILIIITGIISHYGYIYWSGSLIFIVLLIYQHLIVKPNDISRVNLAFATTNGVGSIVFGIFVILELFLS